MARVLLTTPRTRLVVADAALAPAMLDYHRRNRAHLEPWGPAMPDALFTEDWWLRSAERCQRELDAGSAIRLALVLDGQPGRVIGTAALFRIRRLHWQQAELGFGLDAAVQGRGLMGEAVAALLGHAFGPLGLHRIQATCRADNRRSHALLRRLGFVEEGRLREHAFHDGHWHDQIALGLLAREFRTVRQSSGGVPRESQV